MGAKIWIVAEKSSNEFGLEIGRQAASTAKICSRLSVGRICWKAQKDSPWVCLPVPKNEKKKKKLITKVEERISSCKRDYSIPLNYKTCLLN